MANMLLKNAGHLQELLALAQAIIIVVTRYTFDHKTPTLFNATIIPIYRGIKAYDIQKKILIQSS